MPHVRVWGYLHGATLQNMEKALYLASDGHDTCPCTTRDPAHLVALFITHISIPYMWINVHSFRGNRVTETDTRSAEVGNGESSGWSSKSASAYCMEDEWKWLFFQKNEKRSGARSFSNKSTWKLEIHDVGSWEKLACEKMGTQTTANMRKCECIVCIRYWKTLRPSKVTVIIQFEWQKGFVGSTVAGKTMEKQRKRERIR